MGSQSPSLPLIDISPFLDPSSSASARKATADSLAAACYEYGFFYLTKHGIPQATLDRVLGAARAFFTEAPAEAKHAIRRQDPGRGVGDGARGYQVVGENVTQGRRDWHEALDLYREIGAGEALSDRDLEREEEHVGLSPKARDRLSRHPPYGLLQGVNLWPSHPPDFQQLYAAYVDDLRAVGAAVLRAMGEALELVDADAFVRATRDSFWVMRVIGYPPLDRDLAEQGGVSCGQHTDYGCLTLLLADDTKGALQVRHRGPDGAESWIPADPIEGAYVVNVGDMIEKWTNGLVRSTLHRVVHTGQNYRVSVPFFLEPDWDAVVEPLEECVARSGGVAKSERVKYGDHLTAKVGGNFYTGG